jgi:hypothetical protein
MKFLKASSNDNTPTEVTALVISPWRKYMAVGYVKQDDKRCYVAVHNIKNAGAKNKLIIVIDLFEGKPEPDHQQFVCSLAFSIDSKSIAIATKGLSYDSSSSVQIYRWNVASNNGRTSKMVCSEDFPGMKIGKISFHPSDRSLLIMTGPGLLAPYYMTDSRLTASERGYQGLPKPVTSYNFTDHAWTEEN